MLASLPSRICSWTSCTPISTHASGMRRGYHRMQAAPAVSLRRLAFRKASVSADKDRRPRSSVLRFAVPVITICILAGLLLVAVFADFVSPFSPTQAALPQRLLPPVAAGHLLGTDALGRDIFSRLLHG